MNKNDIFLANLNDKIQSLTEQFASLPHIKRNSPCFDAQLFSYQGPLLNGYEPYLLELKTNYQKLVNLVHRESPPPNIELIVYLSELIVYQLEAMQRELATLSLRNTEKLPNQSETLHEQYVRNTGYLNRLESMKHELEQSNAINIIEKKNQLKIIEERLARCRDYLSQLEQRIENDER